MLVLFAVFVFGLMGLAALVIDVGFARLAQRQMQTAAQAAALEGLRFRDDPTFADPAEGDEARRQRASDIVAWTFDDDFDPSADPRQFGAGPVLEFTDGIPLSAEFNASERIVVPDVPVYKPARHDGQTRGLELNLDDEFHGDMLKGTYHDGPGVFHVEDSSYTRDDFSTTGDTAFLVRMRRTTGANPLDAQPGASTRGPTVPFLFGRGGLLDLDTRGRGLTVRATAIADARRAMSAGAADAARDVPGTLPFVLFRPAWTGRTLDAVTTLVFDSAGQVLADGDAVGFVVDPDARGALTSLGQEQTQTPVADAGSFVAALVANLPAERLGYVPVLADSAANAALDNHVIGFGFVDDLAADPEDSTRLLVTVRGNRIAPENATGTLAQPLPEQFRDEQPDPYLDALFEQHLQLENPLLAPVLVR
ncbi:MAG TPA: pilus assembly protein TadG-related protein [Planctomycetaceae bacterium]|nr:pilus assembly protein TadG-related protein [Planctomycetaceae bacterium]